jgi:hypothetical protein
MSDYLVHYILAFVSGIIVKVVDWMEDDRKTSGLFKYPLAAAYGIIIGYLISTASFSIMFFAALVAQIIARKIDNLSHRIGFVIALLSMLLFGFPPLDVPLFSFFLVLAVLDEADFVGKLRPLTKYRLILKAGALAMLVFGRWDYFAAIMLFDTGYVLSEAVLKKPAKKGRSK